MQGKRAATILVVALLAHVALFGIWQASETSTPASPEAVAEESHLSETMGLVEIAVLEGDAVLASGQAPPDIIGPADQEGLRPEDSLRDSQNAPGDDTGKRASGSPGELSFVPRKDRDYRSKSLWNTEKSPQMQNSGNRRRGRHTPESLERQEDPSYSEKRITRENRLSGEEKAQVGHSLGSGEGGIPGDLGQEWFDSDPRFDTAPLAIAQKRSGAASPNAEAPRVSAGTLATENSERGPVESAASAKARSNQKSPSIFDLGAPSRTGKAHLGAGGQSGKSVANHDGQGSAAQAGKGEGRGLSATRASKTIPYFFEMYRRIDREVKFPAKLALALEQGDLVLKFNLNPRGEIVQIRLVKKSGHGEFDSEALRAFRRAAPFGPVPKELLAGRSSLAVLAPYYFRNRLIK